MTTYTVAPGTVIRWSGGTLAGGSPVPDGLLAEWGEAGLRANLDAGSVVAHEPPAAPRRVPRERVPE